MPGGVKTSWILLWEGIIIAVWTTLSTLIATGALTCFAGRVGSEPDDRTELLDCLGRPLDGGART